MKRKALCGNAPQSTAYIALQSRLTAILVLLPTISNQVGFVIFVAAILIHGF